MNICAVVVTHNRKALLRECLEAIRIQSQPPKTILVVNNACTDGTPTMLQLFFCDVSVLNLERNVGGAGGFSEGIKWALERNYQWLWLMDDDTIPTPTALEELICAQRKLSTLACNVDILASKSVWKDGTLHPINLPVIRHKERARFYQMAEAGLIAIRSAAFVSLLVRRSAIEKHGLPISDYFIWWDDSEFTARILRSSCGALVPKSIIVHKSATNYQKIEDYGEKAYFFIRNGLWMITRSYAWDKEERLKIILRLVFFTFRYIAANRSIRALRIVAEGIWRGLFPGGGLNPFPENPFAPLSK